MTHLAMNIALAVALAIPTRSPAPPQADLPPIVVQVSLAAAPAEDPEAPEPSFAELEVHARFSRSVPFTPGVEPGPASVEPQGLSVGEDGLLRIPRPEGDWMFSLTVESDHATGSLGSEALVAGDGPIELVLRRGRPLTLRLVPPADTKYDPRTLVGRALPLRSFQHVATARERLDTRVAEVDEALEVHLRAFAFGGDPHRPGFRPTPLAQQLVPYAIDPAWEPPALEQGRVVDVPLVDTCTLVVHVVDPNGAPVAGASIGSSTPIPHVRWGTVATGDDGCGALRGLPDRDVVMTVEAAGFEPRTTIQRASPGEVAVDVELRPLARVALEPPADAGPALRLVPLTPSAAHEPAAPVDVIDGRPRFPVAAPGLHALAWSAAAPPRQRFEPTGACLVVVPRDPSTGRALPVAHLAPELGLYPVVRVGRHVPRVLLPSWPARQRGPDPRGDEGPTPWSIRLRPVLVGPGGDRPVAKAHVVRVSRAEGGQRSPMVRLAEELDASGSMVATGHTPGLQLVEIATPDWANGRVLRVDAAEGEVLDLGRIELGPPGHVLARVPPAATGPTIVHGVGAPSAAAPCLEIGGAPAFPAAVPLPAGADWAALRWTAPVTGRTEAEVFRLPSDEGSDGGRITVLDARPAARSFDVRVLDRGGAPLSLAVCELHWADGSRRSCLLDSTGSGSIQLRRAEAPPRELWVLPPDEPGAPELPLRGPILRMPLAADAEGSGTVAIVASGEAHGYADAAGRSSQPQTVRLLPYPIPEDLSLDETPTGALRPDGSFVFRHVPDGRFVAVVFTGTTPRRVFDGPLSGRQPWLFATSAPFEVHDGARVDGLEILGGIGVRLPEGW